jgi:hypothetical protein
MHERHQKRSSCTVTGIAGARIELERSECERIERVLHDRKELKLRQDLPEAELEKRIARAVTSIAGAKAATLRLASHSGFRHAGQRQTEEDRHKLATALQTAIAAIDSVHKPGLKVLAHAGSNLGVLRSILEGELKAVRGADLSAVPTQTGCPKGSLFAQPQRALTFALAEIYLDLTGEYPTGAKKRYGFRAFADAMFAAMQTKPPSRHIVEAACNFVPKK